MNSQRRISSDPCHRDGNRTERKGEKEGRMERRKRKKRTEVEIKKMWKKNERTKRREGDKRWKERTLILESSDLRDPFAFTRRKRVADGWSGEEGGKKKEVGTVREVENGRERRADSGEEDRGRWKRDFGPGEGPISENYVSPIWGWKEKRGWARVIWNNRNKRESENLELLTGHRWNRNIAVGINLALFSSRFSFSVTCFFPQRPGLSASFLRLVFPRFFRRLYVYFALVD